MRRRTSLLFSVLVACVVGGFAAGSPTRAATCPSIEQNGVVFTFDRAYSCGQFANGDWWVAPDAPGGQVVLEALTPNFDGQLNGWQVDPVDPVSQGFDFRIHDFDASLVPELPYSARAGESIVKTASVPDVPGESCRPCVQSAAILTVLDEPPSGDGIDLFRPPYPGGEKPLVSVERMRGHLLPSLDPVASAPTFAEIEASFQQPWLDHKNGWTGRSLHPENSMPDYGADIAAETGNGALALMLTGDPDNYGLTYGPDGLGGCVADLDPTDGIGRFPDQHGINANGGYHGSAFHGEMWDAYRDPADDLPPPLCALVEPVE